MGLFERGPTSKPVAPSELPPLELEDFSDQKEVYGLLKTLPKDLLEKHLPELEGLDAADTLAYVQSLAERREDAKRNFFVSDAYFRSSVSGHEKEIQTALETRVFNDENNFLGEGQTARVKSFRYRGQSDEQAMAIKYLLRPREGTISVDQEHDLLAEVEQLKRIEEVESFAGGNTYMGVPHPYFYYRKGAIQCYGMEEIDGVTLTQFRDGAVDPELKQALQEVFRTVDKNVLQEEVRKFFEAMHRVCLHGDIFIDMPGNIMVSRTGKFYVIDFGEATRSNGITEQLSELYTEEQRKESLAAQTEILKFIDSLYQDS